MLRGIVGRRERHVCFSVKTIGRSIFHLLLAVALLLPTLPLPASAAPSLPSTTDGIPVLPNGVSTPKPDTYEGYASGDYHESVDIDVPGFRGLEPDISLDYSSGQQLRYSPDGNGWLGRGWSLSGVPAIDRISRGGGAPRFDGTDTYTLGGQELIPCSGTTSPGCLAGSNYYTTRIESYQRIKFEGNIWTVWKRDGTRYTFYPVGQTLAPPSGDANQKIGWNYRWLLRYVYDTHNNLVTYSYQCDAGSNAINDASSYGSCRIDTIAYGSAEIRFRYATRPDPMSYATGVNRLKITQRLTAIQVLFAGASVRAYAIGYDQSAITGSSRVISIRQYGSDATVAADGTVTAGATPPLPARTYTYQNSLMVGATTKICQSTMVQPNGGPIFILDSNGDLREGILLPPYCNIVAGTPSGSVSNQPVGTATLPETPSGVATPAANPDISWEYPVRGYADFNGDNISDQFGDVVKVEHFTDGTPTRYTTVDGFIIVLPNQNKQTPAYADFVGDLNGDGRDDIANRANVQLGQTGTINLSGPGYWGGQLELRTCGLFLDPCPFMSKGVADINGDGKGDLLGSFQRPGQDPRYVTSWRLSTGSSFEAQQNLDYLSTVASGDYNGDGKTDAIALTDAVTGMMLYSDGRGLVPSGVSEFGTPTDFNGDGRTDLLLQLNNDWKIVSSTGSGFLAGPSFTTMPAGSKLAGFADLAGDGIPDLVTWTGGVATNPLAVYTTSISGALPDLMLTSKNVFGGKTTITYQPSSGTQNTMPFVKSIVASIKVEDGVGPAATTSFTYEGGKYDTLERMFLGFASVTVTKPCNDGETVCPTAVIRYRQDRAAVGQVSYVEEKSANGVRLHARYEDYTVNNSTLPYTALNTRTVETIGNGTVERQRETLRTFDSYGQVTVLSELGANDWTGDERTTTLERYPNTAAYIVDRVARQIIKAGIESATETIRSTETRYDGATGFSTAPTKGDPTAIIGYSGSVASTTSFAYDAYGNRTKVTDPVGAVTTTTFDATYHLFPTVTTNALNQVTTRVFSVGCEAPSTITDPNGLDTTFTYDAHCRETRRVLPGNNWQNTTYNSLGTPTLQNALIERRSTSTSTAETIWEQRYFDGLGRAYFTNRSSDDPADPYHSWVKYAKRGAVASYAKPYIYDAAYAGANQGARYITTYLQDALNRTTKVTLPDGKTRSFSYAPATPGYRPFENIFSTDELGRISVTQHDAYDRTVKTTEKLDKFDVITQLTYNVMGEVTSILDPEGNSWSYVYDHLGRRISAVDPDRGSRTYAYDAAGQLTLETDALGQKTAYEYDLLGRLVTKRLRQGTVDEEKITDTYDEVRSGYSNKGFLTTADNEAATITYDYNYGGQLAKQTWTVAGLAGTKTESTGYYSTGHVQFKEWPDGTSTGSSTSPWTYDLAGRLLQIPGAITWTSYNAADQVTLSQYGSGLKTFYTYNAARDWLTDIDTKVGSSGTTVLAIDYTRDFAGRITRLVVGPTANDDITYAYDELDRLKTTVSATASVTRNYTYNLAGSMIWRTDLGGYVYPTQGATAVRPHAPTTIAGVAQSYDANGNLTSAGGRTFTYDGAGRLTKVTQSTGTVTFTYGPDGDRVRTVSQATGGPVLTTFQLGETTITPSGVYLKAPRPDIRKVGLATCVVHRDQLGTIRAETDGSGVAMLRVRYTDFGDRYIALQGANCTDEARGFIGERHDVDTKLIDLNARWYNPLTALFITPDDFDPIDNAQARAGNPIGWRDNPVGTNRYAYAAQDPTNKKDPEGRAIDRSTDTAKALAMLGAGSAQTSAQRSMVSAGVFHDRSAATRSKPLRVAQGWEEVGLGVAACAASPPCSAAVGTLGIVTGKVIGDALSRLLEGSNTKNDDEKRVTIYRAVDEVELSYIRQHGTYGSNPSQSGKYFALTPEGVHAFAKAPMNSGTVVTSTTLPQAVIDQGYQFNDPGAHGAGPAVFFSQPQLPTVYDNMTPIVVAPGE